MQRVRARRHLTSVRRGAVVSIFAILGLLSPTAAHAATTRSASGNAWGQTTYAAEANAKVMSLNELNSVARSLGEVCGGVTYSTYLIYIVPSGNGYVYRATATGNCAPV